MCVLLALSRVFARQHCSEDCLIADRKRHKPDCFTDKKTTKEKRKEASETFELLTKKTANGMKLEDMPAEHINIVFQRRAKNVVFSVSVCMGYHGL